MSSKRSKLEAHTIVKPNRSSKVGVTFKDSNEQGYIEVDTVSDGGLAASSGLQAGDVIEEIDGMPMANQRPWSVASKFREAEGEINIVVRTFDEDVPDEEEVSEDVYESIDAQSGYGLSMDSASTKSIVEKRQDNENLIDEAYVNRLPLGLTIAAVQIWTLYSLFTYFKYGEIDQFTTVKYTIFRDIMVMLLLGFGYLMTFLEKYGLGAVGFTMLLTALNMQCNLIIENYFGAKSYEISFDSIINAQFSAAALLISFGALIGRASPLQMCFISISESLFYAINKVIIVNGWIKAEDVGGTITIHMFGAYFGLACAAAFGPQEKESISNNAASRVSDVFSLVGTTLLWVYWPSFVGATETGVEENEMHCLTNTIMALIGSTGATFYISQRLNGGKFDTVHIQNSTLAGGVAIGASARLALGPGMAMLVGLLAGMVSVLGYQHSSPFLENKLGIFDTCGVGNLHGYPSVLGGLLSMLLVCADGNAPFLYYGWGMQSLIQLCAIVATLVVAMGTGYATGALFLKKPSYFASIPDYEDFVWWVDAVE